MNRLVLHWVWTEPFHMSNVVELAGTGAGCRRVPSCSYNWCLLWPCCTLCRHWGRVDPHPICAEWSCTAPGWSDVRRSCGPGCAFWIPDRSARHGRRDRRLPLSQRHRRACHQGSERRGPAWPRSSSGSASADAAIMDSELISASRDSVWRTRRCVRKVTSARSRSSRLIPHAAIYGPRRSSNAVPQFDSRSVLVC